MIAVPVRGYDRACFFSDEFGSRLFEKYFQAKQSSEYNGYIRSKYDTTGYFGSGVLNDNPSLICRYGNLMYLALDTRLGGKIIPPLKLVIIVPDDDIIKLIFHEDSEATEPDILQSFSRMLNHIMTEHERTISAFKEHLPSKSLKSDFPQILWVQAPFHDGFCNNDLRFKFNHCMEEVCKLHVNTHSLMLKKAWDAHNPDLFLEHSQRFTAEGFSKYWKAVDHTARYFNSVVLLKKQDSNGKKPCKFFHNKKQDQFKWQNLRYNRVDMESARGYHTLPSLPSLKKFRWEY